MAERFGNYGQSFLVLAEISRIGLPDGWVMGLPDSSLGTLGMCAFPLRDDTGELTGEFIYVLHKPDPFTIFSLGQIDGVAEVAERLERFRAETCNYWITGRAALDLHQPDDQLCCSRCKHPVGHEGDHEQRALYVRSGSWAVGPPPLLISEETQQ